MDINFLSTGLLVISPDITISVKERIRCQKVIFQASGYLKPPRFNGLIINQIKIMHSQIAKG